MTIGVPLERILEVCERFYARDGFVQWTEVGRALNLSRQAIYARLRDAVAAGTVDPTLLERYRSTSSRTATAREKRLTLRRETLSVRLSPENIAWLREEAAIRRVRIQDIVDGLLGAARRAAISPSTEISSANPN